jgi:4-hydroxybenzoate polyprenyltransferase
VLAGYVALNLAYTLRLKSIVLVDAFCIATGFLLRVEAGGLAAQVAISHWAFLVTLFLALFLALNKRRAEMTLLGENHVEHRPSLREYSIGFLDQMTGVLAACTIVAYTMYTVDADTADKFGEDHHLFWTVPFVTFGIGRYMLLVQGGRGGDSPTKIFLGGDPWFLANTLAWAGVVLFALFGPR